jgi:hypothetical protein
MKPKNHTSLVPIFYDQNTTKTPSTNKKSWISSNRQPNSLQLLAHPSDEHLKATLPSKTSSPFSPHKHPKHHPHQDLQKP